MVWVKICGMKTLEDAQASIEAGADAIGFVFYKKSKRYISPEIAKDICQKLPKKIDKVGVFVDESVKNITQIADLCSLDLIQLHGSEPPDFEQKLNKKVIRSQLVQGRLCKSDFAHFSSFALLFDTFIKGEKGGTGVSFNWDLIPPHWHEKRIIIAGGLTPANVSKMIKKLSPWGVDVSSGVEKDGKKDPVLTRDFVNACRNSSGD